MMARASLSLPVAALLGALSGGCYDAPLHVLGDDADGGAVAAVSTPPGRPDAGVDAGAARGPGPATTCRGGEDVEVEPNDDRSQATAFTRAAFCGVVAETDVDWVRLPSVRGGATIRLDLRAGSDAIQYMVFIGTTGQLMGGIDAKAVIATVSTPDEVIVAVTPATGGRIEYVLTVE